MSYDLERYLEVDLDAYKKQHICNILNNSNDKEYKNGVLTALHTLGIIPPAYGWVGHRDEWFYPTPQEVEFEEDWRFQCTDYD